MHHYFSKHWILLLVVCAATFTGLRAQTLDHVQGQILIQMADRPAGQSIKSWAASFRGKAGQSLPLKYKEQVTIPLDIHLVEFDFTTQNEEEILNELRRHPLVTNAQFNHFIKERAIPNDPEFNNQWQYINTGQGGGTPGADIDMELAWDFATGGITANGDTIVACIIDDGVDADHPDIKPNLWVNRDEIPNNGIDDDNNGFVDDYRGWDTGSDSDAVYDGGGHGTPVTGIVGAKGNEGFGVAGVNWDVQLMIVQGGTGVESEVLEAYSYPLVARQRYNETNGAEGAFVVSTNASWGVDFGQPADAPLWCAFYDTLGVHGILNCGATINGNVDVDAQGDLPTACPSDYMIAVTNMNRNDQKVTGAGFGAETIDLGAFGAQTWTTAFGGGFGPFGGTSGATPHVAGTVALLYSLPCPDLMALAFEEPGALALIIRDAIFEGVDQNASLQGITTTGGRLNVHNAVQNVLAQCGGCPQPIGPEAVVDSDTSATITYSLISDTTVNQVNIQYRPVGDTVWTVINGVNSPVVLLDLLGCTDYEYQLQSVCDTASSDFSRNFFFSTLGCCENPETFTATVLDTASVQFDWSHVFAAQFYTVETRVLGTTEWEAADVSDNMFILSDQAPCSTIEYRLRVTCSDTTQTEYTPIQTITTIGCGACVDFEYCLPPEISTADEWISSVIIGGLFNNSGPLASGYQDFTADGPTVDFNAGSEYGVVLTPSFSGQTFNEGWGVFIDLDQNGDFNGPGERLFQAGLTSDPVSGSITIPVDAPEGYTRLRVVMLWNVIPNGCATNEENFGEVEDYCVTILPPLPVCSNTELGQDSTQANTENEIFLDWETAGDGVDYTVRYRLEGTADWTEINTAETNLEITGLENCSNYEFQISSACLGGSPSDFSESVILATFCPPVCAIPTDLAQDVEVDPSSISTVTMTWMPTIAGTEYTLRYRPNGSLEEWLEVSTTESSMVIMGLDSCVTYEVQINADCGGGSPISAFSESVLATTACISSVRFVDLGLEGWEIAPNPINSVATVSYNFATSPVQLGIRLFDQFGRQVLYREVTPNLSGRVPLDLNSIAAGVYYLRIETEKGQSRVKKVVKF